MSNKTFIIAEAGVNHNGSLEIAFKLCDAAKEAQVDAIKFQTFKTEKVISKFAEKAEYQKELTGNTENQFEMVKKLELSFEEFKQIENYCSNIGLKFLSTPDDEDSLDFLLSIGMDIIKISSPEITNFPYLKIIGKKNRKIIMSTGMANLLEIEKAIDILVNNGTDRSNISLLHCNTEYPTPFQDVNLLAMLTMKNEFKLDVGYSDHSLGIEVPIAAVALGAKIIEKHFTLDNSMEGPDHTASLNPDQLKEMVRAIRNIENSLGNGIKKASPSEYRNIAVVRRSIVAAKNIKAGEFFSENNLACKRPGTGISPIKWDKVLGQKAKRDFNEDELIET